MPILVDSFHVMRGSKKDSHLPDIDRDSCYHIHNISKKFCEPFNVICGLTNSTQIYILTLSGLQTEEVIYRKFVF